MTEEETKAVEKIAERVKKYYSNYRGMVASGMVCYFIDQAVKEFKDSQNQNKI